MTAWNVNTRGPEFIAMNRGALNLKAILGTATGTDFDQLRQRAAQFLAPAELEYFNHLTIDRRQRNYLLGRFSAKQALVRFLHQPDPCAIEIRPGVFEQPLVIYPCQDAAGISISHCDRQAVALAFPAGHPMAIDVEQINPDRVETIRSQLTAAEIDWTRSAGPAREAILSTVAWTAKESLSKVLKCGLMSPMEIMSMTDLKQVSANRWEGLFRNFAQYRFVSWQAGDLVLSIVLPKNTRIQSPENLAAALSQP